MSATVAPAAETEVIVEGAEQPEPKAEPTPRYATDLGDLPERVLAARKATGRKELSEALGISQSACWRAEMGRIHPDEVDTLRERLGQVEDRIARGEFAKPDKASGSGTTKADLTHRIEVAIDLLGKSRGDKKVTKIALVDAVLDVLQAKA